MTIAILDYGMGNLRSVQRAVERVGGEPEVTSDPQAASRADALVVPGVGAFGACMRGLAERGLDRIVGEIARSERPVLGVCLGLQVLFEGSEEDPDPDGGPVTFGLMSQPYFGSLTGTPPNLTYLPLLNWNSGSPTQIRRGE